MSNSRAICVAGCLPILVGCSLLVSVDGLSGGAGDAGSASDAGSEGGSGGDAGDAADPDAALTYAAVVLSDKPLAYYRLDETSTATSTTAADATGNGNDGQYTGTVTLGVPGAIATSANGGVADTAAGFAGAGYVDCGDRFAFGGTAPCSFEAWFQATQSSSFQAICGRLDRTSGGSPTNGYFVELYPAGSGPQDGISFSRQVNQGGAGANAPLPTTTWVHVVAVYDGTQVLLYTNGASGGTGPGVSITAANDHFRIAMDTLNVAALTGVLDEVAVYDYALQPARVLEHYRVGSGLGP
jgi:concanavalin A-like lectin/glucanase superfamily protein